MYSCENRAVCWSLSSCIAVNIELYSCRYRAVQMSVSSCTAIDIELYSVSYRYRAVQMSVSSCTDVNIELYSCRYRAVQMSISSCRTMGRYTVVRTNKTYGAWRLRYIVSYGTSKHGTSNSTVQKSVSSKILRSNKTSFSTRRIYLQGEICGTSSYTVLEQFIQDLRYVRLRLIIRGSNGTNAISQTIHTVF